MEATLKSKVTEIFSRYQFSPEDARFIAEVLDEIDERQEQKFLASKELFLTQPDKVEIIDRIERNKTELSGNISGVRTELLEKISETKTELNGNINGVRTELSERISETKAELSGNISEVRSELLEKIDDVRTELLEKINEVEVRLNNRINELESKLTRQIYMVGLVQFLAVVVSLIVVLSFMLK